MKHHYLETVSGAIIQRIELKALIKLVKTKKETKSYNE